jgi:hypothetical protein
VPTYVAPPKAWQAARDQVDACRRQLRRSEDAERQVGYHDGHPEAEAEYRSERNWLAELIRRAHLSMILLVEQLGTMVFLEEYRTGFKRFSKKLDEVYRPEHDPEIHESEALDYITSALRTLAASLEPQKGNHEIDALTQVREILAAADFIVSRSGAEVRSEPDLQKAVFEYLRILHPSARREVPISHVLKTFKADIGIDALELLIEIKFIDSPVEARSQCPGIFEDMFGYRGDPRWKHYFALVYSTGPYLRQEELEAEFALAECPVDWTPIAVWGDGGRPVKDAAEPLKRGTRSRRGVEVEKGGKGNAIPKRTHAGTGQKARPR